MSITIEMRPASAHERESYSITARSEFVYHVTGKGVINRAFPHRVTAWDNTGRPNTEPDLYNQFSGKPGPGTYLDPENKGTDSPTSITLGSEPVAITNSGTNTGTAASGQVYADAGLVVGDTVYLYFPAEERTEGPYVLTARPFADMVLVPAE